MRNGRFDIGKRGKGSVGGALAGRVLLGIATLGAAIVLLRSLPDLVRYFRIRRM